MEMRSALNDEQNDVQALRSYGELLDAADAGLISLEAVRYKNTRARARELIEHHAWHADLESWCEDSWALLDLFEEVMTALETCQAPVIPIRPGILF
jgi:hypothetical protein